MQRRGDERTNVQQHNVGPGAPRALGARSRTRSRLGLGCINNTVLRNAPLKSRTCTRRCGAHLCSKNNYELNQQNHHFLVKQLHCSSDRGRDALPNVHELGRPNGMLINCGPLYLLVHTRAYVECVPVARPEIDWTNNMSLCHGGRRGMEGGQNKIWCSHPDILEISLATRTAVSDAACKP